MKENWTGNKKSIYTTLGASSHSKGEREVNDYYATDPMTIDLLLNEETFNKNIWEVACGEGHLSKRLEEHGHCVKSTDLIDRGYGEGGIDFLKNTDTFDGDIITNPPYRFAMEFVYKSLDTIREGNKVAMFLKLQFLESQKRRALFQEFPPKTIYVSSSRITCAKNGEFDKTGSSAVAYAWFVWKKGYQKNPIIKWIN